MLTDRQKLILSAIVNNYIKSAEPIGSRAISKQQEIGYSPATIRNEMADLEEMGYLEQLHTSSGRIPSNKGYRYYVDHLINMNSIDLSKEILVKFGELFTKQFNQFEQVIEQTAQILSRITNYTSIILGPEVYKTNLKHIQIIPITDESLVTILVTNTGKVEHKTISIPKGLSLNEIERLVNFLNMKLRGIPLYQLKSKIYQELNKEIERNVFEYEQSMAFVEDLFDDNQQHQESKIYIGGSTNILNQPEFSDINTIKDLFHMFETTDDVKQLLKSNSKGIEVKIGTENNVEAASNCSIITANYEVDGVSIGTIGIFGPTRMNYSRVIRVLDLLNRDFSAFVSRLYHSK